MFPGWLWTRAVESWGEPLDGLLAESERTSRLLEDLMLLARAGAGETIREPVDLAELVRDVCSEAAVLADAAGIRLAMDECAPAGVSGDEQALRRLFLILLDSALKYTPRGGEVHVSVSRGRGVATVEVRDTGAGIPAEDLPHVFERFYRAAKDRSRNSGGVGLGLSIAQWITAGHGGEIAVESAPGAGSTFRVRLPIKVRGTSQ